MSEQMPKYDSINPDHYKIGKIETIEFMKAKLTAEQYNGFCLGNALKYISRANYKQNFKEDIKKAIWYLERLADES